jgi:hypothetical protein
MPAIRRDRSNWRRRTAMVCSALIGAAAVLVGSTMATSFDSEYAAPGELGVATYNLMIESDYPAEYSATDTTNEADSAPDNTDVDTAAPIVLTMPSGASLIPGDEDPAGEQVWNGTKWVADTDGSVCSPSLQELQSWNQPHTGPLASCAWADMTVLNTGEASTSLTLSLVPPTGTTWTAAERSYLNALRFSIHLSAGFDDPDGNPISPVDLTCGFGSGTCDLQTGALLVGRVVSQTGTTYGAFDGILRIPGHPATSTADYSKVGVRIATYLPDLCFDTGSTTTFHACSAAEALTSRRGEANGLVQGMTAPAVLAKFSGQAG